MIRNFESNRYRNFKIALKPVLFFVYNISIEVFYVCFFVLQGDSPFGKSEAYIKLDPLGEGSYATVFKGYSK